MEPGLFPALLGASFEHLDSPVRDVHGGSSKRLRGTATVTRGRSLLARALCAIASLPGSTERVAVEVQIAANGRVERWTRYFGDNRPMRSTLRQDRDSLVERLGPVLFRFRLRERDGGIDWTLKRVSALGIGLPLRWFRVRASSGGRAGLYAFAVEVALIRVGLIIRYEGEIGVVRSP